MRRRSASRCPSPAITRSGSSSCRATRKRAPACEEIVEEAIAAEGLVLLGWRDMPVDNAGLGERVKAVEPVQRQIFIGRGGAYRRRGRFRAQAVHSAQGRLQPRLRDRRRRLRRILSRSRCRAGPSSTRAWCWSRQLAAYYGPARPALRDGAGAGPPALRDQHFPVLAARPPLPDGRPQRRDQHAARQRQLDGGAAGERRFRIVRQRHLQAVADLLRGPVRHRLFRQRARVPRAGRLFADPRDDDADPGGLGRQPADGRGAARLLRISRRDDGAVGRPGRRWPSPTAARSARRSTATA